MGGLPGVPGLRSMRQQRKERVGDVPGIAARPLKHSTNASKRM